jgi:lysozyme
MRASKEIKELIKSYEGLRLKAYDDGTGVWTIGYGHIKGVKKGQTITKEQADKFFDDDLYRVAEYPVSDFFYKRKITLTQDHFDAIVCFTFNLGFRPTSTLIKKGLANQDDKSIWGEFLKWNKAGGKVMNGLTKRRTAEANWYFGKKK